MPRENYPFVGLTFGRENDQDWASILEAIREHWSLTKGRVVKQFLRERLVLYRSGWKLKDDRTLTLFQALAGCSDIELEPIKKILTEVGKAGVPRSRRNVRKTKATK